MAPIPHGCPTPQWMVAIPATWPPAWQHPNMGVGASQIHQGNPERKRENAQSGTKEQTEAEGEAQDKGYSGLRGQSWS